MRQVQARLTVVLMHKGLSLPLALFLEEVAAVARAPVFLRRMLEATDLQTCEEAMFDHKTISPAASGSAQLK